MHLMSFTIAAFDLCRSCKSVSLPGLGGCVLSTLSPLTDFALHCLFVQGISSRYHGKWGWGLHISLRKLSTIAMPRTGKSIMIWMLIEYFLTRYTTSLLTASSFYYIFFCSAGPFIVTTFSSSVKTIFWPVRFYFGKFYCHLLLPTWFFTCCNWLL
jgi:hypothetical protein